MSVAATAATRIGDAIEEFLNRDRRQLTTGSAIARMLKKRLKQFI
jgi:hypothetical protein